VPNPTLRLAGPPTETEPRLLHEELDPQGIYLKGREQLAPAIWRRNASVTA